MVSNVTTDYSSIWVPYYDAAIVAGILLPGNRHSRDSQGGNHGVHTMEDVIALTVLGITKEDPQFVWI